MQVQFEALAEDALLLRLGERIDAQLNRQALALAARVAAAAPPWLRDVVPAYASVAVFFDPQAFDGNAHAQVRQALQALLQPGAGDAGEDAPRPVEIPVCYGGEHGPDLETAARELGLNPTELAQRHSAGRYRVAMIGFASGFPYLIGLDPALALPRLATPRTRVPAGSVAVGGAQTGVYPRDSAGGWRLLGRTPLRLFDAQRAVPSLLAPGDAVVFRAIDAAEFDRLAA